MRKIAATRIFPISKKPLAEGYIVLDDANTIVDVVSQPEGLHEIAGLEYYSGILIPALVLTHNDRSSENFEYMGQKLEGDKRLVWQKGVQAYGYHPNNLMTPLPKANVNILEVLIKHIKADLHEGLEQLTLKTATQLGLDDTLGSFDIGKKPGVLLLSAYDIKNNKITEKLSLKRLV